MLQEKTKKLMELRAKIDEIGLAYDEIVMPLKAERDRIQTEILTDMKSSGQYSVRFDFTTVTMAVRKSLTVLDEAKVIAYLKAKKLAKEYVSQRLNRNWESYAHEAMKAKIEIPGTEIIEKEYISLRTADEDDKRKITVK